MKRFYIVLFFLLSVVLLLIYNVREEKKLQFTEQQPPAKNGVIQQFEKKLEGKLAWEVSFENGFDATNTGLIAKWDAFIRENNAHISNYTRDVFDAQGNYLYGGGGNFEEGSVTLLSEVIATQDMFEGTRNRLSELEAKSNLTDDEKMSLEGLRRTAKLEPVQQKTIKLMNFVIIFKKEKEQDLKKLLDESVGSKANDYLQQFLNFLQSKEEHQSVENRDNVAWTPDIGYLDTYQYNALLRDKVDVFRWYVKPLGSSLENGYEHDAFLYYNASANNGTYLTRDVDFWGYPICAGGWNSNLNHKYLDTRFLDNWGFEGSSNEIQYSIGTAFAYFLNKNIDYWTIMRMRNGDATTDFAKVQAQKSYQIVSGCSTIPYAFCIYGSAKATVLPFPSSSNVPGYRPWSF